MTSSIKESTDDLCIHQMFDLKDLQKRCRDELSLVEMTKKCRKDLLSRTSWMNNGKYCPVKIEDAVVFSEPINCYKYFHSEQTI